MTRRCISLADFVGLKRGYDLPTRQRGDGSIPILGSFGITGTHDVPKHSGPGVSIGRSGASIGVATYCPDPYWPLNTTLYVNDFKGNNPRFVYYVLDALDFADYNSGSAQPSLNRNYLTAIPIPEFDITEQAIIVAILGSIDDLIENNRRRIEALEEMAQVIYREWFVHFRYPGHEGATFIDSPLGPIPEGWTSGPLLDLAEVTRSTVHPHQHPTTMYRHYSLPAFDQDRQPVLESGESIKSGKYALPGKCVLLSKLNPRIPRVWYVDRGHDAEPIASTEFLVLSPKPCSNLDLVYLVTSDSDFQDRLQALAGGTSGSHQRAKPNDIMGLEVVVPPLDLRTLVSTEVGSLLSLSRNLNDMSTRLRAIRNLLLPKLVTGEIDVSRLDLDALVEAAS